MDLNHFLNLLAVVFGAWGALHVLHAVVRLTPKDLGRLAQTSYDFSPRHARALAAEWADAVVGLGLVSVAFGMAFTALAIVPEARWGLSNGWAALCGIILFAYLMVGALRVRLTDARIRAIGRWFVSFYVERQPYGNIEAAYASIAVCAEEFLGMQALEGEDQRAFMERVAESAGVELPSVSDQSGP